VQIEKVSIKMNASLSECPYEWIRHADSCFLVVANDTLSWVNAKVI